MSPWRAAQRPAGAAGARHVRRAGLALVVASRIWSASMLASTVVGTTLAAPTSAPALEAPQVRKAPAGQPPAAGQSGGTSAPVEAGAVPLQPQVQATVPQPPTTGVLGQASERRSHRHGKRHHGHHRRNPHSRRKSRHPSHQGARGDRPHARALRPAHLDAAAARRTGGALWIPPPRPAHSQPTFRSSLPSVGAQSLSDGAPVVLPGGLSALLTEPPSFLIPIYKQAARRYHVPWRVLAAINSIETDYGRDLSVSSQGALGWMQFMPATWHSYGAGGNPYAPRDAIFAAARLLRAAGAAHDLRGAIFAYNHASWYVAAVLWRASTIATNGHAAHTKDGYALPLDARYMRTLGRTDDGVDIETAPDGAAVYTITPGVVVAVAGDPGGFGPNYPVVLATGGPLTGRYIYYGHVAASLVHPGQQLLAGQPMAIVGHTGDAAGLGHGHIEIGFCDASGDPLNHHGAQAWTPSGQVMHAVLSGLSLGFGIAVP